MVWVDQRDVAKQHLALADDALARAAADPAVSKDLLDAVTQLRSMNVALAKLAGVAIEDDAPTTR